MVARQKSFYYIYVLCAGCFLIYNRKQIGVNMRAKSAVFLGEKKAKKLLLLGFV